MNDNQNVITLLLQKGKPVIKTVEGRLRDYHFVFSSLRSIGWRHGKVGVEYAGMNESVPVMLMLGY